MLLKYSAKFGEISCGIFKQQNTEEFVVKEQLTSWENTYAFHQRRLAEYKLVCKIVFQTHSIKSTYLYVNNYLCLLERGRNLKYTELLKVSMVGLQVISIYVCMFFCIMQLIVTIQRMPSNNLVQVKYTLCSIIYISNTVDYYNFVRYRMNINFICSNLSPYDHILINNHKIILQYYCFPFELKFPS